MIFGEEWLISTLHPVFLISACAVQRLVQEAYPRGGGGARGVEFTLANLAKPKWVNFSLKVSACSFSPLVNPPMFQVNILRSNKYNWAEKFIFWPFNLHICYISDWLRLPVIYIYKKNVNFKITCFKIVSIIIYYKSYYILMFDPNDNHTEYNIKKSFSGQVFVSLLFNHSYLWTLLFLRVLVDLRLENVTDRTQWDTCKKGNLRYKEKIPSKVFSDWYRSSEVCSAVPGVKLGFSQSYCVLQIQRLVENSVVFIIKQEIVFN